MRTSRTAAIASLAASLAIATPILAAPAPARYFDLVNASHDSVTALAVAPAGEDAFREIDLGPPLRGGLTSTTVEVPEGGCLRDFRVALSDGRTLLYPGIDVCRYRQLRLSHRDGRAGSHAADRSLVGTP